jgi:hypothetical protein
LPPLSAKHCVIRSLAGVSASNVSVRLDPVIRSGLPLMTMGRGLKRSINAPRGSTAHTSRETYMSTRRAELCLFFLLPSCRTFLLTDMLQAEDDAQQQDVRKLQPVTVFVLAEPLDEMIGKPAPNRGESRGSLSIFFRCCYGVFPRLCQPSASQNEAQIRI